MREKNASLYEQFDISSEAIEQESVAFMQTANSGITENYNVLDRLPVLRT